MFGKPEALGAGMLCGGAEADGDGDPFDIAGVGDCEPVAGGVLAGLLGAAAGAVSAGGGVLVPAAVLAGVGVLVTAGGFALCAGGWFAPVPEPPPLGSLDGDSGTDPVGEGEGLSEPEHAASARIAASAETT